MQKSERIAKQLGTSGSNRSSDFARVRIQTATTHPANMYSDNGTSMFIRGGIVMTTNTGADSSNYGFRNWRFSSLEMVLRRMEGTSALGVYELETPANNSRSRDWQQSQRRRL